MSKRIKRLKTADELMREYLKDTGQTADFASLEALRVLYGAYTTAPKPPEIEVSKQEK